MQILQLPKGSSIEDLLPDRDKFLDIVVEAAIELVNGGVLDKS